MSFELDDPKRREPVWARYVSGSVDVRFLVRPRDPAVVRELHRRYPIEERLSRRGRVAERSPDRAEAWVTDYLVAHLADWDGILLHGEKAPITTDTVARLSDNMRGFILDASGADQPADYADQDGSDPLAASGDISKPGSTSPA